MSASENFGLGDAVVFGLGALAIFGAFKSFKKKEVAHDCAVSSTYEAMDPEELNARPSTANDPFSDSKSADNIQDMATNQSTNETTKTNNYIGGIGAGISSGATIGSVVPGIGTAIGAAVGGAVGVGMGFLANTQIREIDILTPAKVPHFGLPYLSPYRKVTHEDTSYISIPTPSTIGAETTQILFDETKLMKTFADATCGRTALDACLASGMASWRPMDTISNPFQTALDSHSAHLSTYFKDSQWDDELTRNPRWDSDFDLETYAGATKAVHILRRFALGIATEGSDFGSFSRRLSTLLRTYWHRDCGMPPLHDCIEAWATGLNYHIGIEGISDVAFCDWDMELFYFGLSEGRWSPAFHQRRGKGFPGAWRVCGPAPKKERAEQLPGLALQVPNYNIAIANIIDLKATKASYIEKIQRKKALKKISIDDDLGAWRGNDLRKFGADADLDPFLFEVWLPLGASGRTLIRSDDFVGKAKLKTNLAVLFALQDNKLAWRPNLADVELSGVWEDMFKTLGTIKNYDLFKDYN